MKLQELSTYRKKLSSTDFIYRADLFSKAIWGDMGEDCASIFKMEKMNPMKMFLIC